MISNVINESSKIVIKIGSNTLAGEDGFINVEILENIANQVYKLVEEGKKIVIVTSGARIAGTAKINKWTRKEDIHYKQALCAIGQVELMEAYRTSLSKYDVTIAQMLLIRDDFNNNSRTLNVRNTLFTLVDEGVIPIINENDSVSTEEIQIGDNDTLAALTAQLWGADLLILLSDIDGVYNKNPKISKDAVLIERVLDIDSDLSEVDVKGKSDFGTGGIKTKIESAKKANDYGIPMILTNGKKQNIILRLKNNEEKATLFAVR